MSFHSILFVRIEDRLRQEPLEAPAFFADLNLDQIVDAATAGRQGYNLKPFFYAPLHNVDAIRYRHEVMQDLEDTALFKAIKSFAHKMHMMREHLVQVEKLYYKYQQERWFLDAAAIYCDAVQALLDDLTAVDLRSRGFLGLREYLAAYVRSERFISLVSETDRLTSELSSIQYFLLIKGSGVTVSKYEPTMDYSVEVERTFEKFKQGTVKDYTVEMSALPGMNHVEAQVLDRVALLFPDIFSHLDRYCEKNGGYLDEVIGVFDREIQFYMAYLEHIATLKREGLKFCYPRISDERKEVCDFDGFDLALANKLGASVVCNDFFLKGEERIFVVTGPNQGGKTTFSRMFGQLHYLASLGFPVPGRDAQLFLFDQLFTHFEKEEDIQNLGGKLQDDLVRIHDILSHATSNSIIIMNEIFTSTTLEDAIYLSKKLLGQIMQMDLLCICVTFIDELVSLSEKTVSMVSTVAPENPALRTFKVVRKPADGLSYALSIAEKYRLTYESLKERIKA